MSEAAKSFAARLGTPVHDKVPPKGPKGARDARRKSDFKSDFEKSPEEKGPFTPAARSMASRIGTKNDSDGFASTDEDISDDGKPKVKYLTPKQKRELANKIKAAKLQLQQAKRDAELQEEVRAMFEKMSDKSTSWADIEDEM